MKATVRSGPLWSAPHPVAVPSPGPPLLRRAPIPDPPGTYPSTQLRGRDPALPSTSGRERGTIPSIPPWTGEGPSSSLQGQRRSPHPASHGHGRDPSFPHQTSPGGGPLPRGPTPGRGDRPSPAPHHHRSVPERRNSQLYQRLVQGRGGLED